MHIFTAVFLFSHLLGMQLGSADVQSVSDTAECTQPQFYYIFLFDASQVLLFS